MSIEKTFIFTCPGKVKGLKRTKASVFAGHARVYEDSESKTDKACVRLACAEAMKNKKIIGIPSYTEKGVSITICACFIPPASLSKKKRKEAVEGVRNPLVKPDIDNVAKLVLDALNGVLYKDDKDIYSLSLEKKYDASFEGLMVMAQWEEEGRVEDA